MAIHIKSLSPTLLPDWLHFFDNIAFVDNADWADCYCACYQLDCTNKEWSKRTKEQNRKSSQEMIVAGKMHGYLAFDEGAPVGWCNVNSYSAFPRLSVYPEIATVPKTGKAASIICFIIANTHRGKGIARTMLQQAIADSRQQGFDFIEAYPRIGDNLTPADQFHGPIQLYLSERFEVVGKFEKYDVVRKQLKRE